MRYLMMALALSVSATSIAAQEEVNKTPNVQDIVEKANLAAYYQGDDGKSRVSMVIANEQGQERNREFNILRKDIADGGDQNYYVYFMRPADVRGMVYMVHKHAGMDTDDDRWLYMPALDLVKRIAASDKRTSFAGSDFLYEDVSGRSLDADTHELSDETDGVYIVKNIPERPESVEFSYYNVHISKENWLPVKMEFYDKHGKVYRTIESVTVKNIEAEKDGETVVYPTVVKSVVKDLNRKSTTTMEFSDIEYNIGLGDLFSERYLRRPPREARR